MEYNFVTNSAEETIDLGRRIGEQLRGGEVFAISGALGSGKTHLIKGIAGGTGAADVAKSVTSPTFVIVNEYEGRFDIYHIDAYRLNKASEFEMLGFDDYCYPESVVLIEWADKVERNLAGTECVKVNLTHEGEKRRGVRIENLPGYIKFK